MLGYGSLIVGSECDNLLRAFGLLEIPSSSSSTNSPPLSLGLLLLHFGLLSPLVEVSFFQGIVHRNLISIKSPRLRVVVVGCIASLFAQVLSASWLWLTLPAAWVYERHRHLGVVVFMRICVGVSLALFEAGYGPHLQGFDAIDPELTQFQPLWLTALGLLAITYGFNLIKSQSPYTVRLFFNQWQLEQEELLRQQGMLDEVSISSLSNEKSTNQKEESLDPDAEFAQLLDAITRHHRKKQSDPQIRSDDEDVSDSEPHLHQAQTTDSSDHKEDEQPFVDAFFDV